MVQITDDKGNKAQAFDLILTKDNAYAILSGRKTIEFRKYSDFYISRFCPPKLAKDLKAGRKDLKFETIPCFFVHFHDYNNTWSLNVAIEAVDFWAMTQKAVPYLHEHKCFEMDNLIAENEIKGLKPFDEDMQWVFCLPIAALINTTLDTSRVNLIRKMDIPEEFWVK